jgi:hypothetical protein
MGTCAGDTTYTDFSRVHPSKAETPIVFTELGIEISFNFTQFLKV